MTEQELNDLLWDLENAGFSADEIHDAIEFLEISNDYKITDLDPVDAAIEITRTIMMDWSLDNATKRR